jgi:recombination protein RecR
LATYYPPTILELIRRITRLPGIGEKTAERLALHCIGAPRAEIEQLARALMAVKEKTRTCRQCFALSDEALCRICADPARDNGQLCVVEQATDMVAVEKSGAFRGRYHILQGALSPMDGVGPENLRIAELRRRLEVGGVEELILATSPTVAGDATAAYIAQTLTGPSLRVSRIACGVPIGGDLKFVDQATLKRALDGRHGI